MTNPNQYDLELKLAELRINGYVLFEDLIPVEKIDRIREAFLPYLETVQAHSDPAGGVQLHGRSDSRLVFEGRLQVVNRYTVYVPWEQPFADPEIYENPVVLDFLDRYWGTDDYRITCYHSNNPYPGSEYQKWHRDAGISKLVPHVGLENLSPFWRQSSPWWTLLRKTAASRYCHVRNTSLTRRWRRATTRSWKQGSFPSRRRLNLKKGTLWIQDPRTLHRGTPNRSDHPRPELVICYSLPWFGQRALINITQEEFDKFSGRGRKMLANCRVIN